MILSSLTGSPVPKSQASISLGEKPSVHKCLGTLGKLLHWVPLDLIRPIDVGVERTHRGY